MRAVAAPALPKTLLEFLVGALRGSAPEIARPYSTSFLTVRKAIS
ncbi:hypothetical protein [Nocardia sp. NPDC060249]